MPNVAGLDTRVPAVLVRLDRNPFHHGTLGAVRSLGRAGVEVHAVIESAYSPVAYSRHLRRAHLAPDGRRDTEAVEHLLLSVARHVGRPAVLVPLDDVSAVAVSRLHERLAGQGHYLLPDQPAGLAERVADKAGLAALCAELGVPHPRTLVPGTPAEAAEAAWSLGLPAIAKWSRPWLLPPGSGLRSTQLVRSAREAHELHERGAEAAGPGNRLLIQELLPAGRHLDWFFHGYSGRDGTCAIGAAGRKERSWPVGAGLTAVGRWLPNAAVERAARETAAALGYRGTFDLDFRLNPSTGEYHLLDFNPRPGAQFRLFADRWGMDVVRAQHMDLTGRALPAFRPAEGRTFVVENYALLSMTAAALSRQGGAGTRWHTGGAREWAWFAADDPRPAAAMAATWTAHAVRRAWRRAVPGRAAGEGPRARDVAAVGAASAAAPPQNGNRGTQGGPQDPVPGHPAGGRRPGRPGAGASSLS